MSTRKRIRNQINSLVIQVLFSCLWEKDSDPNQKEKAFFDAINNIRKICQYHLESEYGPYLASHLNSPLYYKQIEYYDKKGNKKTKKDESSATVHYAKLTYSEKSNN